MPFAAEKIFFNKKGRATRADECFQREMERRKKL
jgi:hypothetical protein